MTDFGSEHGYSDDWYYDDNDEVDHGPIKTYYDDCSELSNRTYSTEYTEEEKYEDYMNKLIESFNPMAAEGVMCRNTISVGWDGKLFDCDFNQMLELGVVSSSQTIKGFKLRFRLLGE